MKFSIEKHQTLRERILDAVRDAIINGEFKPGERVAEGALAERFGISRTPIREAIRQLESEGFLEVIPRKGAIIASVRRRDIEEFYEIKSLLEGFAARKAAEALSEEAIARMEQLNNQMEEQFKAGRRRSIAKIHNEFHETFLMGCGNDRLIELINQMVQRFQRYRIVLAIKADMQEIVEQHRDIIAAFRKRDADAAEEAVKRNALEGAKMLLLAIGEEA